MFSVIPLLSLSLCLSSVGGGSGSVNKSGRFHLLVGRSWGLITLKSDKGVANKGKLSWMFLWTSLEISLYMFTYYILSVSTHFLSEPMRYRGTEKWSVSTFYWLVHVEVLEQVTHTKRSPV